MIACGPNLVLQNGDVAVLTLAASLTVPPRAFASSALVNAVATGQAVGFGVGSKNPVIDPAGIKRVVEVPMVSANCNGTVATPGGPIGDATYYKCASGRELVAGAPSFDKDTCKGDSGGPLYVLGADGGFYLAATTSRATGTPGMRPCGDGGIYVRTDGDVVNWIESLGIHVIIGPPK
jgi:secreted trypsin-like serine protease